MHKNTGRASKTFVRSDQYGIDVENDVNGREGMFLVRCLWKALYERFWSQGDIMWRVEVADIEEGREEPCPLFGTKVKEGCRYVEE